MLDGVDVSPALISEVTGSIEEEVKAWQDRPLEALYPNRVFGCADGENAAGRPGGNRAVYTAIGIKIEGEKSVLGLWVSANEGPRIGCRC